MIERKQVTDRHGRVWTATRMTRDEAEAEDFRFWFEGLTPEERVVAVYDCLQSSLQAQGLNEVPRLRRVHRRIERTQRQVAGGGSTRGGLSRPTQSDEGS